MMWSDQEYYRLAQWGYGCYQQGDLRRARIIFSAITEARPTDSYAARGLAGVALQEGKPEEAMELMTRVLRKKPHDAPAQARLVEALIAVGRHAEAQQGLAALQGRLPAPDLMRLELRLLHALASGATSAPRRAITNL